MSNSNANGILATMFKMSICGVFCPQLGRPGRKACKNCPANKINSLSYGSMKISDLLQVSEDARRRGR